MWDAIVIGAGISGCSVARELARYKLKVLVLEKGHDLCAGTTRGNSATVHAGYDPDPGSNKAIYNVRGSRMYEDLCKELDVPYMRNGMIVFATDEEQLKEVERLHNVGNQNGVRTEICDRKRILEIEPDMGEGVIGGLWIPDSGMVCPYNLVFAMAENAARNGVEFKTGCAATEVKRGDDCWIVSTPDGDEETRYVFNAAGTWADKFNNMVSKDTFKIIPREGQHLILDRDLIKYTKTTICQTPEMTWKIRISPTTPKKESTRSSTTLKRNGTSSRSANTCRNSQEMLSSPLTVEAALIRTAMISFWASRKMLRTSSTWQASNLLVSLLPRRSPLIWSRSW